MSALDVSLFDVENVEQMPKVRDMHVGPASQRDVTEFTRRYHYTATGGMMTWRWGLWSGPTLLGIITYNLPTRDVCESVFGAEHHDRVWCMGRLAVADTAPHNSESRLIAGSLHAVQRSHPHVWAVVTYAATDAGHIGTVYQATNALYTGSVDRGRRPSHYVDAEGRRRGTYLVGKFVSLDRARRLGWTPGPSIRAPRHRYLYLLGSRTQRRHTRALLRWPVLPYPKAEQRCERCAGTGEQFPTTPCEACAGTGIATSEAPR